ncbi:MAG TPA: hypothetical protein VHM88_12245 [Candidatus Acidoferrales bacterium]|nr:hypothetical protein [Candidatus Acidoferrales bacterium]
MITNESNLTLLELGVKRQRGHARLWRVTEHANRPASIREKKPSVFRVERDYLPDSVKPARRQLSRKSYLESLPRSARFEPRSSTGNWHAIHRRPGPLMPLRDRTDRPHMRRSPFFGRYLVHHADNYAVRVRLRSSGIVRGAGRRRTARALPYAEPDLVDVTAKMTANLALSGAHRRASADSRCCGLI